MKRTAVASLLAIVCCLDASAHEQPTHLSLTFAALHYLTSMGRPGLPQAGTLAHGTWDEDAFLPGFPFYFGRFYFHFLPTLDDTPVGQSANCNSIMWGVDGNTCTASSTVPAATAHATAANAHSWQAAVSDVDVNNSPTNVSWDHLGYVVHLLEDLTSPPHTRNSAHPCVLGFAFCDPFEPDNNYATVDFPQHDYVDFNGVTSPQDFFQRVQSYTHDNYFSARTVFNGSGGPNLVSSFEDSDYFYGPCLQASIDFGNCDSALNLRKIAHKGLLFKLTQDPRRADIDSVIAHEQFRELGPVAVQAVAEFIKFYAPALSVSTDGTPGSRITSTPAGVDCGTTCAALFVNGTTVQLTAQVPSGYSVQWTGDCTGTAATVTLPSVTADTSCRATFSPLPTTCPANTVCGKITDRGTGLIPLHDIVVQLYNSSGFLTQQTRTDAAGRYSFSSTFLPSYFVNVPYAGGGQRVVQPGGQPADFGIIVPGTISVTSPTDALALFTLIPWQGPPPCQGGGCPAGTPFSASIFVSRSGTWPINLNPATYWMTCYPATGGAQTSNVQVTSVPQQVTPQSCPP